MYLISHITSQGELHSSEQRNNQLEQQVATLQERNRALTLVEENNQTLAAKLVRLQVNSDQQ